MGPVPGEAACLTLFYVPAAAATPRLRGSGIIIDVYILHTPPRCFTKASALKKKEGKAEAVDPWHCTCSGKQLETVFAGGSNQNPHEFRNLFLAQ